MELVAVLMEALENLSWTLGGVVVGVIGTAAWAKATGQTLDFSKARAQRKRPPDSIR